LGKQVTLALDALLGFLACTSLHKLKNGLCRFTDVTPYDSLYKGIFHLSRFSNLMIAYQRSEISYEREKALSRSGMAENE
jgi:hypothetical protein